MFEMTEDGFTFLAMGFTGAKADAFKGRSVSFNLSNFGEIEEGIIESGIEAGLLYPGAANRNHSLEEKYSTLAHELGHIFCGHLGTDRLSWWDANINIPEEIEEIEAESVAYLVCMRQGLQLNSQRYLSSYRTPDDIQLSFFGLNAV